MAIFMKSKTAKCWLRIYLESINLEFKDKSEMDETIEEVLENVKRIREIAADLNRIADETEAFIERSISTTGYPKPRDVYY